MIRRLLFWASAALVGLTYVGAPIVVLARGALRPRPVRAAPGEPSVSVVIAARNEAASIGARLANLAAIDYPADCLEVVLASDGSEDETVAIARAADMAGRRFTVLDLGRVGKADALNAAVRETSGEIVVFTDANTSFAPGAVRALVEPFADPEVGGVAGNQVYTRGDGAPDARGERSYWDFDRLMKRAESAAGSTVSATGAIYALRREIVPTILAGVTDDFYTSTAVIAADHRLVFVEGAVAYEPPAESGGKEYGRKVRIISRGFRGVLSRRALLDPRRTGFYAFQLAWHKVLRRLMAVPVLVIGATSLSLASTSGFFRLLTGLQATAYGLAAAGLLAPSSRLGRSRPAALAAFFVLVNTASLHAAVNVLRGHRIERWDPARPTPGPPAGPPGPAGAVDEAKP